MRSFNIPFGRAVRVKKDFAGGRRRDGRKDINLGRVVRVVRRKAEGRCHWAAAGIGATIYIAGHRSHAGNGHMCTNRHFVSYRRCRENLMTAVSRSVGSGSGPYCTAIFHLGMRTGGAVTVTVVERTNRFRAELEIFVVRPTDAKTFWKTDGPSNRDVTLFHRNSTCDRRRARGETTVVRRQLTNSVVPDFRSGQFQNRSVVVSVVKSP